MFDPLLELEIILGVLFWLGAPQLVQYRCRWHQRHCELKRRRSKPKYPPLPGLLEKPHCEHCAVASEARAAVPSAPPVMRSPRGREKLLRMAGRIEPTYLPFPSTGRLMGAFSAVVQSLVLVVLDGD